MFRRQIDILAIGDLTTDAFIRLKNADIHCTVDKEKCELCMPFGAKIPFEYAKVVKAVGNAANVAVTGARLGLRTALLSDVGSDQNGKDSLVELQKNKVVTSFVKAHPNKATNYHFVLWYEDERTILVNHVDYDHDEIGLGRIGSSEPKWLYLTSLALDPILYVDALIAYLDEHPQTRLAFQPGTFQIEKGIDAIKKIYARTDVFAVNVEEAQKLLHEQSRDIKNLLSKMRAAGPKIVLITDGTEGSYMFDGDHYYHMPMYPDARKPFERTGCGDAFAGTFVSALVKGHSPLEALVWAPVNPMSVAQFIGSQEGLLSLDQIEWWLSRAPAEFKPKEI